MEKNPLRWLELWEVFIFHEKTKVFSWMVAAKNKGDALIKTIRALAFYYPDVPVKDYMITFKNTGKDILV